MMETLDPSGLDEQNSAGNTESGGSDSDSTDDDVYISRLGGKRQLTLPTAIYEALRLDKGTYISLVMIGEHQCLLTTHRLDKQTLIQGLTNQPLPADTRPLPSTSNSAPEENSTQS